ncbi:hypothetical protein WN943_022569 [Citrus x changshan-huyou]
MPSRSDLMPLTGVRPPEWHIRGQAEYSCSYSPATWLLQDTPARRTLPPTTCSSRLVSSITSFIKFSLTSLLWIVVLDEMHGCKACLETERTALLEIKSFFISASDIGYDDEALSSWFDDDEGMSSDCCDNCEGVMDLFSIK